MNKRNQRRVAALVAIPLLLLSGIMLAEDGAVGSVEVGGSELFIMPNVSYAELQVTVAGEGVYWQKRFAPGERASVPLSEVGSLSDGSYSYQVIASPAVDEAAWQAADGNEAEERKLEQQENAQTYIQSDDFDVAGGQIQQAADEKETPQ